MSKIAPWLRCKTAFIRSLPDFLIIGGQKCGTTSLYQYLLQHPCIAPIVPINHNRKEIRYFSKYYNKGINWYKAHFPSILYQRYTNIVHSRPLICGESTPIYMFYHFALKRIQEIIPDVKLIVLLRNPIDRAYSHYNHVVRLGKENLSFEDALDSEHDRIKNEYEKMCSDENYISFELSYHSYISRGIYADQLEKLFTLFTRKNVLILNTEALFNNTQMEFDKVLRFLELPPFKVNTFEKYNEGLYVDMKHATRRRLEKYFKTHNQRLFNLIGEKYQWN